MDACPRITTMYDITLVNMCVAIQIKHKIKLHIIFKTQTNFKMYENPSKINTEIIINSFP